jgi:hypothetical protein
MVCRQAARAIAHEAPRAMAGGYNGLMLPVSHPSWRGNRRRVKEHIVIAEETLGRRLKRGECVHHLDGDKSNNRRSNLLICTNSYHRWLHERMSLLYAREHFGARVLTLARSA